MAQDNDAMVEEPKPEITKIEYNFPTEDGLRYFRGNKFDEMQDSDIEFVHADRTLATDERQDCVRIWFDNGAHIRYQLRDETAVTEAVYRADHPSSVWDSVNLSLTHGGREDFIACVESSLNEYLSSRRDTVGDFEGDWTLVYEIINE